MRNLRWLSLFLAVCILLSACGNTAAQSVSKVEAAGMRLAIIEGTVSLSDEEGKQLEAAYGMRLFSGVSLATETESRAGIALDESKAATLGQLSGASVHQREKTLSLELEKGELFFLVNKHLEEDERFDISTAAMTLGIRGTSGYVESVSGNESVVILTSGEAVITASTGEEYIITAGKKVDVTVTEEGLALFEEEALTYSTLPPLLLEGLENPPTYAEPGSPPQAPAKEGISGPRTLFLEDEIGYTIVEVDDNGIWRTRTYYRNNGETWRWLYDEHGRRTEFKSHTLTEDGRIGSERILRSTYTPGSTHVLIEFIWDFPLYGIRDYGSVEYEMQAPENHADGSHEGLYDIVVSELTPAGDLVRRTTYKDVVVTYEP